jgi:hypothetical protein
LPRPTLSWIQEWKFFQTGTVWGHFCTTMVCKHVLLWISSFCHLDSEMHALWWHTYQQCLSLQSWDSLPQNHSGPDFLATSREALGRTLTKRQRESTICDSAQ